MNQNRCATANGSTEQPAQRSWGGRRPGAGRKPKITKTLVVGGLGEADDAAYALQLVSALMRDEAQPAGLRLEAALEVLHWARNNPSIALRPTHGEERELAVRRIGNVPLSSGKVQV